MNFWNGKLCHEFYSTYEFNEVCADDELKTKKIIKFRLGGRAYSLTLLEFAHRLGSYHAEELDEEGFDVYFQGEPSFEGVAQDDHLWLVSEDNLFITKLARKARVLSDEVIRSLSAPIYCRDLDTTTLRDLIDYEGRLIPEDPQPNVPRYAIPRAQRASMQDLYERMCSMEILQAAIERMAYRQSYQWDRYAGVFEHMAGIYSVSLQGAYNPPGMLNRHYDQYYQQYPPQQQQQDDE
ncbi:hypothetical protein Tco_1482454 [Tanacetum coccineum]